LTNNDRRGENLKPKNQAMRRRGEQESTRENGKARQQDKNQHTELAAGKLICLTNNDRRGENPKPKNQATRWRSEQESTRENAKAQQQDKNQHTELAAKTVPSST
jgi:hypothetical protein